MDLTGRLLPAAPRRLAGGLRRLARRCAAIVKECQYAQRRMAALSLAADRYVIFADPVPDTYGDFLFRTSGPLRHEPSARDRATGRRSVR
jgi:hypothetical protein